MSFKQDLEKTGHDIKDAANEAKHRVTAGGEHAKRDLVGDDMTVGEKAKSVVNEIKNRAQAEVDRTKREVRDKT
jgi:F0F1-type ATP synthase membrane subunit b/b'